jgi:beta-lactamase regulating signal transducer with metallopeptidase domain
LARLTTTIKELREIVIVYILYLYTLSCNCPRPMASQVVFLRSINQSNALDTFSPCLLAHHCTWQAVALRGDGRVAHPMAFGDDRPAIVVPSIVTSDEPRQEASSRRDTAL